MDKSKWYQPSRPTDIKPIPWLAPEAIVYLEGILKPEFEVIEHGAGGSTLWFAERVKCVLAFENDPDWERQVERQVSPTKAAVVSGFPNPQAGPQYDLLLIDGEPVQHRAKWLTAAPSLVKPGGWIVLDNANRPEYKTEREGLKQFATLVYTVNSNASTHHQYLVTEFWRVK
jgi:predicted O-methyltransferase YrrM